MQQTFKKSSINNSIFSSELAMENMLLKLNDCHEVFFKVDICLT